MRSDLNQVEVAINASLIQRPVLLDEILLTHDEFYDTQYGLIFRTIQWLYEKDKPISVITITEKLHNRVDKEHLIAACDSKYAEPWAVQEHARIIRDSSRRRQLVKTAQRMMEIAESAQALDDDVLSEVEKSITDISVSQNDDGGPVLLGDVLGEHLDILEVRKKHQGQFLGIDTGYRMLNYSLGGWKPGQLYVVAARPAMGKTAFMLQSASAASTDDVCVLFSIEMIREMLVDRMLSSESYIPLYDITNGRVKDGDWSKLSMALTTLEQKHLYIDDNPYTTISYIRTKLLRLAKKLPKGKRLIVYVDYLQIVKVAQKGRSRNEEIGDISQDLKALSKELNCSVVALAQVNRSVEQRQDKRPGLSDIRDSGQVEQDADVIMFLYRDEYYNPNTERPGVTEILIAKNRHGSQGKVEVVFAKEFQRFIEMDGGREK